MERISILNRDITTLSVDAVVNAANNSLLGGGGVDGAIHAAAGPQLYNYCKTLNGCKTGEAKITPGFNLPAKYIIHTVGPVWRGGAFNENLLLQNCYKNCLITAVENNIITIAFPSISTGAYRFPLKEAAEIAVDTVKEFLEGNNSIDMVYFITFGSTAFDVYSTLLL
jgi:O-acetyl-ADP-ribose deacetylase (regulator of RNase III)